MKIFNLLSTQFSNKDFISQGSPILADLKNIADYWIKIQRGVLFSRTLNTYLHLRTFKYLNPFNFRAPFIFAPLIFAPLIFAPLIFAPLIFAPLIFAPLIFAPFIFAHPSKSELSRTL